VKILQNKFFRASLLIITVVFVVLFCISNIRKISEYDFHIRYVFIVLSLLSASLGTIFNGAIWYQISRNFGIASNYISCMKIWLTSRLGRYVPGKLPFLLLRISMSKGVSAKIVTQATITEYFISIGSAVLVALLATIFIPYLPYMPFVWILGSLFLLVLFFKSCWINAILNLALRQFGKPSLDYVPKRGFILKLSLQGILPVMFHGLSLFLLFYSLEPLPISLLPAITGVYYSASLLGLLAFFAPGGIGVREGLMMVVLSQFLSVPTVIVASMSIRIVTVVSELVLISSFNGFYSLINRKT